MTKDLTRGTPWKLIVQFALPIMAGNLLQQLYNTADTIIVGNFNGQQALSAVGACASLTALFTALAIGFSIGAGVLISQYFGALREQALRQYAATAIVLMLAMGLLMSLIGVCSAGFLLARALGTPEALLPLTLLYFRIYAAGLVFQFGYNIAAALLRALGDSKATLYFLLVSSILNVVLDLVFVAGLGMGVAGAAIATVISQIASCGIGFAYMHRRYALLRFSLRELRMDLKTAGRILQVGAPMAIQQSIVSCGFLFLQRLVNYYGESMYMCRHGYISPIWSRELTMKFMRQASEEKWPMLVHDCSNHTKFARDLNLRAKEGGWFGASAYHSEFTSIPYAYLLPTLTDESFFFVEEEELPRGYRPGEY